MKNYPQKKILNPNQVILIDVGDLDLTDDQAINYAFLWKNKTDNYIVKRKKKDIIVIKKKYSIR